MKIGIPKEIKTLEGRVGLIPEACADLVRHGHEVFAETQAGVLSGYDDGQFKAVGVKILPDADTLYDTAEMIVKVKEPVGPELNRLKKEHLLFSYLHLAAEVDLAKKLCDIG